MEPWLAPHVSGEAVALDIGAHHGEWAAMLHIKFDEVHCFEPDPQNVAAMPGWPNVRVWPCALGSSCGDVRFNRYAGNGAQTSMYGDADLETEPRGEPTGTFNAPIVTLDRLGFYERPVDFIKIDVEGAELEVLRGSIATIHKRRPTVLIEAHSRGRGSACEQVLKNYDYEVVQVPHPHPGAGAGHFWIVGTP